MRSTYKRVNCHLSESSISISNTALVEQDTRKPYAEPRFVAVGYLDERLHVLCFTPIDAGIRVISFRKANSREVKHHAQALSTD